MSIVLYLAKLTLVSGILYSYYWFVLRNKRFHLYNRFYLSITVIISLILPCISIPIYFYNSNPKILQIISIGEWEPAVVITPAQNWLQQFLTWQNIFFTFYILVCCIMLYVFAKSIRYVMRISKKYEWEKIDDIKLFYTNEPESPFSFFKNIFWNNDLNIASEEGKQIFQHEIYHVRKKHSIEVLLMEIICCIFCFNPFYHLIKKEIKTIHEFLADEYASSGVDKFGYAELLVWQTINTKQISIINPFFHNQIKRRIVMITQLKNKRYHYASRIMILPVLFILFCAFGTRIKNSTSSGSSVQNEKKSLEENSVIQLIAADTVPENKVYHTVPENKIFTKVDVEADYPGGYQGWEDFLIKTCHYPQEAINKEIKGTVVVQFIVGIDGNVSDVKAISGPKKGGLREEAVRVIKNSGKWIPAKQNNKTVRAYKKQPIHFMLQDQ